MIIIQQNNSKSKWKLVEKVVAILEKSLTPAAKVEHNVWLPVIDRSGRRQCDVVITYGEAPHQYIVIVEVQKRNTKPEITTFDGWVMKMRKVGAQKLICVSAVGYPKSIIEDVEQEYGSTVKLLTLKELKEIKIGNIIFPFNSALEIKPKFIFKSIGLVKLDNPPLNKAFNFSNHDKIFEIENEVNLLNLDELISKSLDEISIAARSKGIPDPILGTAKFVVGSEAKNLWIHNEGQRFKILSLPIEVEVSAQQSEISLNYYEYRQKDVNSPLAWAVSIENKGIITFSLSNKEFIGETKSKILNTNLLGIVLKAEVDLASGLKQPII